MSKRAPPAARSGVGAAPTEEGQAPPRRRVVGGARRFFGKIKTIKPLQIKTFFVPLISPVDAELEMNRFLRGNKVLTVGKEFCREPAGWSFCVSYLGGTVGKEKKSAGKRKEKVDYREVLSAERFLIFTILRKVRKVIRGGSWNNNPSNCRAANRNNNEPTNRNNNVGFRLARSS